MHNFVSPYSNKDFNCYETFSLYFFIYLNYLVSMKNWFLSCASVAKRLHSKRLTIEYEVWQQNFQSAQASHNWKNDINQKNL